MVAGEYPDLLLGWRLLHGLDPDRIQVDVTREDGKILIFINKNAFISSLVQVSDPIMPSIVITGISDIELAHEFGKVPKRCFDQEVKMVVHKDIRVEFNSIDIQRLSEYLEKARSISVILEDYLPFVSATSDMVDCIRVLDSKRPSHGQP